MAKTKALTKPTPEHDAQKIAEAQAGEAQALAYKMANDFNELVKFYIEQYKVSPQEAIEKSQASTAQELIERAQKKPARDVEWFELRWLQENTENGAFEKWQEIKQAARDELASGVLATNAIEGQRIGGPIDRARFLAVRQAFVDDWQPSGGIEGALIDTLAQAHHNYLEWIERLTNRATFEAAQEDGEIKRTGKLPAVGRLNDRDYIEHTAQMAERFNRLFLRTLRGLRDLRRYSAGVHIEHAGQVNIGAQQMNAAKIERAEGEG